MNEQMSDIQTNEARYAIGIDLGTTHSALSYVDLQASDGEKADQGVLGIPQLSGPGTVEPLPLLPSFLYLPHPDELAPGDLALPWTNPDGSLVVALSRNARDMRRDAYPFPERYRPTFLALPFPAPPLTAAATTATPQTEPRIIPDQRSFRR